jgi:iron(III) transport system substrate-binding protein
MRPRSFSRRQVLKTGAAAVVGALPARVLSAAPEAVSVSPDLVSAATKEGKVNFYTAMDLPVAEKLARAFEVKYPGIVVRVERSGSERVFQRIAQEIGSNIHNVDIVNTSDAAHVIFWKRNGWLAPFVPSDVSAYWQPQYKDPEGTWATVRIYLSVIAYNTNLVRSGEAPTSFADLLDPKWTGKLVKGHPGYSGTIMTATHQMARDLGWDYFEKLAKQKVTIVGRSAEKDRRRRARGDGRRWGLQRLHAEAAGRPGRGGLRPRRLSNDFQSECNLRGRGQSQCGAAVPMLDVLAGSTAIPGRNDRTISGPHPGQGASRPQAAARD